ncbi:hypothetical protein RHMOL_Rhmol02G0170600 [Rhododendron molle]|uniref:Uncharacterized protein n=1 Tax=Rhododendron molle TaxID=49168 RepID=A0ACC0PTI3_RHOML|nr:hypothetical protein RHMOL_Rhmol02G0170600 [Rhododendron molle]
MQKEEEKAIFRAGLIGTINGKRHLLVEQKLPPFVDAFHQYVTDRVRSVRKWSGVEWSAVGASIILPCTWAGFNSLASQLTVGSPGEVSKRSKRSFQSNSFIVEIGYAVKIPLKSKSISLALQGAKAEKRSRNDGEA